MQDTIRGWFGRQGKGVLGVLVAAVAVVPSFWLAVLEQRANTRLIDEVDRGLRSDAVMFVDLYRQIVERMLYDGYLRPALEGTRWSFVPDSAAPGGAYYQVGGSPEAPADGGADPLAYPFFIDFADGSAFVGRGARHVDELARTLARREFLVQGPPARPVGRGTVDGPYGPFHYAYRLDSTAGSPLPVMRGVKVDEAAVKARVLPAAFQELVRTVRQQRRTDEFPGGLFRFTVATGGERVALSQITGYGRAADEAIRAYAEPFHLDGLFPGWTIEVAYLNELKARRWLSYLASVIPLVIVVLGVVVTARMAMREAELNRTKSLFVSNVSHELKTPLTKINLFNELLQGLPPEASEKRTRYHDIIHQECERLTMLVDNVLDLGRIERGQMTYEFTEVPVEEVIGEVAETFNVIYEARGYRIELRLEDDLPVMRLDPGAVKQALINLTDNAVKYSKEPHTIVVRAARSRLQGQPAVAISVTDRGVGIPREKLRMIFEEFYRVHDGKAPKASGSGLGLALVRHIVDAHGGTVEVESKEGAGSTFTISLPVQRPSGHEAD